MASPVQLSFLFLVCAALRSALGQTSFCNQDVAVENGRECECSDTSKIYDYGELACVDQATLYTLDACGPNAGGTGCPCDAGWTADEDTGLCTEATDLCADGVCGTDEECMNLPGRSYCRCKEYSYRFSDTECNTIDETFNPQWHDCPQGYEDITQGYTCLCAEPYFIDVDGDGKNCVINATGGYEDCSTKAIVCASKDGEESLRFPRSGYNATGDDIDECTSLSKTYCWAHSECLNLDDGQGYLCKCNPGYTDSFFDTPLKECVYEVEPHCSGCACDDACGGDVACPNGTVCAATSACSADCAQSLEAEALQAPPGVALYTGVVVAELPQFNYYVNHITLSLEAIFGRQDVQVLNEINDTFTFHVTTLSGRLEGLTADEVQGLVQEACQPLGESDLCQLPGGVVTANASISVQTLPSCTESSCPSDEHQCVDLNNGRYECQCVSDGTGEYAAYFEICSNSTSTPDCEQVAAELQKKLDDTEKSLTATAAALGTLLAVALVSLGVVIFLYVKK